MPRVLQKSVSKSLRLTPEQWRRFQPLTKALGFEIPFTEVVTEALDRLLDQRGIKPPPSSGPEPFRLPLFSDEPILEDPPADDAGELVATSPATADSSTSTATSPAPAEKPHMWQVAEAMIDAAEAKDKELKAKAKAKATSSTRSKKKPTTSPAKATSSTRSKKKPTTSPAKATSSTSSTKSKKSGKKGVAK